jgi:hypothetical protein
MSEENQNTEAPPAPQAPAPRKFGLDTVIADAKAVLTGPMAFYERMATTGGLAEPAIFAAVMGAVSGLIIAVLSLIGFGAVGAMAAGFVAIFIMPIVAVIGSFIGGAVMFVIWKLMGSERSFEASYRSVAHATALYPVNALIGLVPYLGTIVGLLWGFYLMYCATLKVHAISEGKARLVLGILAGVMLFFQVGAEITTRNMQANMEAQVEEMGASMEDFGKAMEKLGTTMEGANPEEMTPEEAGKAVGDFFRGMSEAMQKAEAEARAAAEEASSASEGAGGG